MKFLRCSVRFLVLLLALGVAGREAPEYVSLSDDVSNDGELVARALDVGSESTLASLRSCEVDFVQPKPAPLLHPKRLTPISWAFRFLAAGRDLLHRLNLQRK